MTDARPSRTPPTGRGRPRRRTGSPGRGLSSRLPASASVLLRAPRQGFAGAGHRPPLTRRSAPEGALKGVAQVRPEFQVRADGLACITGQSDLCDVDPHSTQRSSSAREAHRRKADISRL